MSFALKMELITPERVVYTKEVIAVTVPGSEGDFGVLPGHAPFLSMVRAGELLVEDADGFSQLAVSGGFAEVLPERVTVLVDQALTRQQLDLEQIQTSLREVSQKLANLLESDPEYAVLIRRMAFYEACQEILLRKTAS